MTFNLFDPGDVLPASQLMENFRHNCGRGSAILPQDQNGNLLTDKSINIGSNTNQFGDIYCNNLVQSSATSTFGLKGFIKFNPNYPLSGPYSANYSGTTITATKTSHGFLVGDSITINQQTGNNSVLNGAWEVTAVPSANTFQFKVNTTPAGALTNFNAYRIQVIVSRGPFSVVQKVTTTVAGSSGSAGDGRYNVFYDRYGAITNFASLGFQHTAYGRYATYPGLDRSATTFIDPDGFPNSTRVQIIFGYGDSNTNNFAYYNPNFIDVFMIQL